MIDIFICSPLYKVSGAPQRRSAAVCLSSDKLCAADVSGSPAQPTHMLENMRNPESSRSRTPR